MKFYCQYLVIRDEYASVTVLNSIIAEKFGDERHFLHSGTFYKFDASSDERFFDIYIEYGNPLPRPEHIIDITENTNKENPRKQNEVEPKQLFFCIDTKESLVWMSNIRKKAVVERLLTGYDCFATLKNIYEPEEFIDKLKGVNMLRLSYKPDQLFNQGKLNRALEHDIYGFGASEAMIEFRYEKTKKLEGTIGEWFKDLFGKRVDYEYFMISGRDDGDIDVVFNNESLAKKKFLKISPDESGIYDTDEVFATLKATL